MPVKSKTTMSIKFTIFIELRLYFPFHGNNSTFDKKWQLLLTIKQQSLNGFSIDGRNEYVQSDLIRSDIILSFDKIVLFYCWAESFSFLLSLSFFFIIHRLHFQVPFIYMFYFFFHFPISTLETCSTHFYFSSDP